MSRYLCRRLYLQREFKLKLRITSKGVKADLFKFRHEGRIVDVNPLMRLNELIN